MVAESDIERVDNLWKRFEKDGCTREMAEEALRQADAKVCNDRVSLDSERLLRSR